MLATDAVLPSTVCSDRTFPGSIRNLELRDLADVARLLVAHRIDARTIEAAQRQPFPRCHLLVLDVDGHVRALVYVVIAKEPVMRGCLQLLIVDPALVQQYGHAVEARLIGVTEALCEAYGCAEIDIAAARHEEPAAAPLPVYAVG